MARRIMRAFKMQEISAVDRPAQVHARVSIMKRDVTALPMFGEPNNEEANMTLEDLKKMIDDAVGTAVADLKKTAGGLSEEDVTKRVNDAVTKALTDAKTAMDADLAKGIAEGIKAEIAKRDEIAKGDEILEVDGKTLRKSEVGEASFAVMKSLYEDKEINSFSKRAETEVRNLPGVLVEKAKALRAVSKIADEGIRNTLTAMLKSGSEAMGKLLKSVGHDAVGDDGLTTQQQIDKKVSDLMAKDAKLSKVDALSQVMSTSEGQDLYKRLTDEKKAA